MRQIFTSVDILDWNDFVNAKMIKELFPDVSYVQIRIVRCISRPDIKYMKLGPNDRVHLSIGCLNPDCTSKFLLTRALHESLITRNQKVGTVFCTGYESRKPGASICPCQLDYSIKPIIEE